MQIITKFQLAITVLCLITSISPRVIPDSEHPNGDGFEGTKMCQNEDPNSVMNTNECNKTIDETSTAYTNSNYTTTATTLPSSTVSNATGSSSPVTVASISTSTTTTIATTTVPNSTSGKSQREVRQSKATDSASSTTLKASTSAALTPSTTPISRVTESIASKGSSGATTEPSFVLTADRHPTSKSPSKVVVVEPSSTTAASSVINGTNSISSNSSDTAPTDGSSSGSVPVALNAVALVGLLAVATFLQQ